MTHQERVAARQLAWRTALDAEGVTEPTAALLHKVRYGGLCSPEFLPRAAPAYNIAQPVTEDECRIALADCFARGWLQVIDEPALARIAGELRDAGILGPVYGFPLLGAVDYTPVGAALWQRLLQRTEREPRTAYPYSDVVHRKQRHYFRSLRAAQTWAGQTRAENGEIVAMSEPREVGPWRLQWWRRFPYGFCVDIETRTQWGGREGNDTGWDFNPFCSARWRPDPSRLRNILDRHNVTVAEWFLFTQVEFPGIRLSAHLFDAPPRWAERDFGFTVSADELKTALDNCLRYEWLAIATGNTSVELREQLRTDQTLAPVPRADQFGWNEVMFTAPGAGLYRAIAAEFAGPDWEDDLCVHAETYREEHRYCETEEGFRHVAGEYAAKGEVIRATRVVPLGPWCVSWWERFESGYRLEMEIGDPNTTRS